MVEIDFWWPIAGENYTFVVAHYNGYHIERSKFVAELSLWLTDKPRALLEC